MGKSSLVLRFVKGQFMEFQESTIGAAFLANTITLDDQTIRVEIWDTAGQERYHSLAPMYYRGAQAAIVVYDVTSAESFERAQAWVKELQRQGSPNVVVGLAGNKVPRRKSFCVCVCECVFHPRAPQSDMADHRQVEGSAAKAYAEENGLIWMETSAKLGTNVNELFIAIAKKLPKTPAPPKNTQGRVDLASRQPQQAQAKGGCCG